MSCEAEAKCWGLAGHQQPEVTHPVCAVKAAYVTKKMDPKRWVGTKILIKHGQIFVGNVKDVDL